MNNRELAILKENTSAFGLLEDWKKKLFVEVGTKNCLVYAPDRFYEPGCDQFFNTCVYRVRQDFRQPKTYKEIRIPVVKAGKVYKVKTDSNSIGGEYDGTYLSSMSSAIGFAGVIYEDPKTGKQSDPLLIRPIVKEMTTGLVWFDVVGQVGGESRPATPVCVVLLVEENK